MVDLLAPDAPHDVALLGDAAACRTASSGARYGGTREHMSLSQGDHMSMERRRAQEPFPEVRENTCRSLDRCCLLACACGFRIDTRREDCTLQTL